MLEIERNFIVDTVPPEIPRGERCIVHQLYLATGIEEVRVRKLVFADREEYYIGCKYGTGEIREEFERPITKESYLQILSRVSAKPIVKTSIDIVVDGQKGHWDHVRTNLYRGLQIVEFEFESIEEARSFHPPAWVREEVTNDPRYRTQSMWLVVNGLGSRV